MRNWDSYGNEYASVKQYKNRKQALKAYNELRFYFKDFKAGRYVIRLFTTQYLFNIMERYTGINDE